MGRSVKSNKRVVAMAVTFGVLAAGTGIVGCRATRAGGDPREPVAVQRPEYRPDGERVVNLLTDVSHDYSFNLSWADRNQREIYPGFNCLTSVRTIHRAALGPINALVLLLHAKLPYSQEDAGHVLRYVAEGGGVYLSVNTEGDFRASLDAFLKPFGLQSGDGLSDDPADWGICAHAPSELTFEVGEDRIGVVARVRVPDRTGVEMEALSAVSVSLLTIYDMCKAVDKRMVIDNVRLIKKTGGRSGTIQLEGEARPV